MFVIAIKFRYSEKDAIVARINPIIQNIQYCQESPLEQLGSLKILTT